MIYRTSSQLGERFGEFIRQEVDRGRFHSETEVLEAALELLQERETRLAKLRAELQAAELGRSGALGPRRASGT